MERCTVNTDYLANYRTNMFCVQFQQYSYYYFVFSVCLVPKSGIPNNKNMRFTNSRYRSMLHKLCKQCMCTSAWRRFCIAGISPVESVSCQNTLLCINFNFIPNVCSSICSVTFIILAWIVAIYDHIVYVLAAILFWILNLVLC